MQADRDSKENFLKWWSYFFLFSNESTIYFQAVLFWKLIWFSAVIDTNLKNVFQIVLKYYNIFFVMILREQVESSFFLP